MNGLDKSNREVTNFSIPSSAQYARIFSLLIEIHGDRDCNENAPFSPPDKLSHIAIRFIDIPYVTDLITPDIFVGLAFDETHVIRLVHVGLTHVMLHSWRNLSNE
jgi:hypothetical protein